MQPSGVFGRIRCLGQQARAFTTNTGPSETAITLPNGKQLIVGESDITLKMPAEFGPHAGCWLAWPKRPEIWRADGKPAKHAFTQVVNAISKFEPVTVIAHNAQWQEARNALPEHVRVVEMTIDDSWLRDTAPTFVLGEVRSCPKPPLRMLVGIDWGFNGWGDLFGIYEQDKLVARKICEAERLPCITADFILEGGSIHVDGEGTLLTTEECLLHPNRNPNLTKSEIEDRLKRLLGVSKVIWLPRGLFGDTDTNGHIDNFACFAKPGVVLLAWTDDESDPHVSGLGRCGAVLV